MPKEKLNLLILSGSHVEDPSDRFELVKQEFETLDAVFVESVVGDEPRYKKAQARNVALQPIGQ